MNIIHHSAGSLSDIGNLLKKTFSFYKKHFKQLVFIGLIPACLSVLNSVISLEKGFFLGTITFLLLVIVFGIGGMVVQIIAPISFIRMIRETEEGRFISVKELYTSSLKLFWPVLWIYLLMWTATIGGFFLLIIPGMILSVYLLFPMYSFVISGHRGIHALSDSFYYVRGHFWPILGRLFVIALIVVAFNIVLVVLGILIYFIVGGSVSLVALTNLAIYMSVHPSSTLILSFVFSFINWCLVSPIMIYYTYSMLKSFHAFKPVPHAQSDFNKTRPWLIALSVVGVIGMLVVMGVGIIMGYNDTSKNVPSTQALENLNKINLQ